MCSILFLVLGLTTERLRCLARLVPTKSKPLLILREARQSRLEGRRLMMTTKEKQRLVQDGKLISQERLVQGRKMMNRVDKVIPQLIP